MKTVHDFTAERVAKRARSTEPPAPLVLFNPVDSLTACMNDAECPDTARKIFKVLFSLGLESVRARGVPVRPDVAVFHLPVELLAAHIAAGPRRRCGATSNRSSPPEFWRLWTITAACAVRPP